MTMADRHVRVRSIFERLVDTAPDCREANLQALCEGDAELRREVVSLLRHAEMPVVDLEIAAGDVPVLLGNMARQNGSVRRPERLAGFRILRSLGEGAVGAVFLAEQETPKRLVAIKVLRSGFIGAGQMRRFLRESEMLARLQHPGIAQIHQVIEVPGTFGPEPCIVMEYVDGITLTEAVRGAEPGDRERRASELLIQVADAVQHAHLRGVIHRDLKPANILVSAEGRVKVLDFGVARSVDEGETARVTATGQWIGTPAYMSPEQAGTGEVDLRSDLYAMGVLLHEALTDALPLPLRGCPPAEAVRILREEVPRNLCRGEVGTIVARALDRDPARRYQSADAFARDLRRLLRGEPIEARRDSVLDLMRVRLRRWRRAMILTAIAMLGLAILAFAARDQAQRFERVAERETLLRADAESARAAAAEAERDASRQRDEAAAATAFLADLLGLADPDVTRTLSMSVRVVLDGAAERLDGAFVGKPEARATIHGHLGRAYAAMGEPATGRFHLQKAVAALAEMSAVSDDLQFDIVWPLLLSARDLGTIDADRLQRTAESLASRIVLAEYPELDVWYRTFERRAAEAVAARPQREAWLSEVSPGIRVLKHLGDHLLMEAMVADPHSAAALHDEALMLYRQVLPEIDSRVARGFGGLIAALLETGAFAEAEALAQSTDERLRRMLPPDHWYLALQQVRRAEALLGLGRSAEAAALLDHVEPVLLSALEPTTPVVVSASLARLRALDATGRREEARHLRELVRERLALMPAWPTPAQVATAIGPDHFELTDALHRVVHQLEVMAPRSEADRQELAEALDRAASFAPVLRTLALDVITHRCDAHLDRYRFSGLFSAVLGELLALDARTKDRTAARRATMFELAARRAERVGAWAETVSFAGAGLEAAAAAVVHDEAMIARLESLLGGGLVWMDPPEAAARYVLRPITGMSELVSIGDESVLRAFDRLLTYIERAEDNAHAVDLALAALRGFAAPPPATSAFMRDSEIGWRRWGDGRGYRGGAAWEVIRRPDLPRVLHEEVEPWTRAFLDTSSPIGWNLMMRAMLLTHLSRPTEALEVLAQSAQLRPDAGTTLVIRILAHVALGQPELALEEAGELERRVLSISGNIRSTHLMEAALRRHRLAMEGND